MAARLSAASLLCALAAASAAAAQAPLSDPTRPPLARAPQDDKREATEERKASHRLQSVLISPKRKLAVIDGRTVVLGGAFDGAHVVAITETGVTLRRGAQTETLPLNAGVEKKAVTQ